MKSNHYHIVIVRSYGDNINLNTYNCQELGLAKALVRKGLKVTLIMPFFEKNKNSRPPTINGVNIEYIKIKWKIHARYCWFDNLEQRLSELKPSILQVHDMDLLMTWRCVRWAKRNEIRCVLIQGPYDKWKQFGFRQFNELYNRTFGKYVIKNVTRIGVKTKFASDYLNKYITCQTQQIIIGLDTDTFNNANVRKWREELNLGSKKILLYVGSIQPRRNPLFLIDVISKLPEDYVLLVVGDGVQMKELKEKIFHQNLDNRCFLLGKLAQSDLPSLYKNSDCFLLASDYEILGMVIMEAMFFGLPVISTKTTGALFILDNNNYGILIEEKNAKEWALSIQKLLDDKQRYDSMSRMSKQRIIDTFIWDKAVDSFMKLYYE